MSGRGRRQRPDRLHGRPPLAEAGSLGRAPGDFVALNNRVLDHFRPEERRRIGVHTCPGGDRDSTHSADVDYAGLLPVLFQHHAGRFYVQLASERTRVGPADHPPAPTARSDGLRGRDRSDRPGGRNRRSGLRPGAGRCQACARSHLGTTDDCGFAPFADDASTSREVAFQKIRARVDGTALAARRLSRS